MALPTSPPLLPEKCSKPPLNRYKRLFGFFVIIIVLATSILLGNKILTNQRVTLQDRATEEDLTGQTPTATCTPPVPVSCSKADCGIANPKISVDGNKATLNWGVEGSLTIPDGSVGYYQVNYGTDSCWHSKKPPVAGKETITQGTASCTAFGDSLKIDCSLYAPDGSYRAQCDSFTQTLNTTVPTTTPSTGSCAKDCVVSNVTLTQDQGNPSGVLTARWNVAGSGVGNSAYRINVGFGEKIAQGNNKVWANAVPSIPSASGSKSFNQLKYSTQYEVTVSCYNDSLGDRAWCSDVSSVGTTVACTTCEPTATPTPTLPTYQCNSLCNTISNCPAGLSCLIVENVYRCVKPACPRQANCICPAPTNTPTTTPTATLTPTRSPTNTPTLTPTPIPLCYTACANDTTCPAGTACLTVKGTKVCANRTCPERDTCVCLAPTSTPTQTPTATPTATNTPAPTATPTIPQSCFRPCTTSCQSGLTCIARNGLNLCLNASCPSQDNCTCPQPTNTPTNAPGPTLTPTPVLLAEQLTSYPMPVTADSNSTMFFGFFGFLLTIVACALLI